MNTYADYLATQTVKTLNTICKQAGIKGYSKLRKAELVKGVTAMAELAEIEAHRDNVTILDVENPADHDAIAALIAEIAVPAKREIVDARGMDVINNGARFVPIESAELLASEAAHLAPVQTAPKAVFSSAPTATSKVEQNVAQDEDEAPSLDDLKSAYRNLRTTVNNMGARGNEGQRRIRYVGQLRNLSAQLATYGVKAAFL